MLAAATLAPTACVATPEPPEFECDDSLSWPDVATLVTVPDGMGGTFRIDAVEVIRAQYRLFLEATGGGADVTGQPSYCEWNDSFAPDEACLADDVDPRLARDDLPVVCVDWCDAYMYCQWVGKRLCGPHDGCVSRGGSLLSGITCRDAAPRPRSETKGFVGLRCCAD